MRFMICFIFGTILASSLAMPASVLADEVSSLKWHHDVNKAWSAAKASKRPLLVFVNMKACHYCRKMQHETFSNRSLVADI